MRWGILGTVAVWDGRGSTISVGGPRVRALLALLLLNAGKVVSVEALIDGLYGDGPPAGAGNALQSQVSRLRRALKGLAEIEASGAGYRLAVDPQAVDAHRFLRLAGEAAGRDAGEKARILDEALGLWRGEALADVPELRGQALRFEEARVTAIEDQSAALLELGGHRDLVAPLRELVEAHPLRERPRALLMRALYGSGRQGEALELYERTRRMLADELGTDPSAELSQVHLAILRGEPEPAAGSPLPAAPVPASAAGAGPKPASGPATWTGPGAGTGAGPGTRAAASGPAAWTGPGNGTGTRAATAGAGPEPGSGVMTGAGPGTGDGAGAGTGPGTGAGNGPGAGAWPEAGGGRARVPAQFTSFVGRDEDLARITALLGEARLVTLIGPGGAGKTRLAIEAGGRTGAVFVDFAAVASGEGQTALARTVMGALGLREAGVLPSGERLGPVELLETALGGLPAPLIFDNCEHVVDAAAQLARRLLAACPGLRVLATSREALGITGETLWPVRQLPVPDSRATLVEAVSAPAVRLFADRASAADPAFEITVANLEDTVRICEALDGQPLAIELAAARLRTLSVAEIADRLDDRFRLLSRGDRTQSPRHQTLRAVVEWSWDLLRPEEQRLARRLSVFTGGFTAAAARKVCGGDEDLLLDLADRSLLQRTPSGRYRMLQTIYAYCAEQLETAGEKQELRRSHAEYFLARAREADAHLRSAEQVAWLERLDADQENLHAALRWALDTDTVLASRFVGVLASYWWLRGIRSEGSEAGLRLLEALGDEPPPDLDEEYVIAVALVSLGSHEVPELPSLVERGERLLEGIDRPLRQPFLLAMWALTAGPPGGSADVETLMVQRGVQFDGHPWNRSLVEMGFAYLHLFEGRPDLTEPYLDRALADFRALGERWGMTQTLDALASVAQQCGDPGRALSLLEEALVLVRELGSTVDTAEILCRRGDVLAGLGLLGEARTSYLSAADPARRTGAQSTLVAVQCGLGDVARLEGDLDTAAAHYERALADCPPRWYTSEIRARALLGLARLAHIRGDDATALTHATAAADAAHTYRMDIGLATEITRFTASLTASVPPHDQNQDDHMK
ncbi:AfsR/SARP family transcriptional regulator [Actinocorallia populi]|uniref:AfsR/SARP family transcriptional regulator n=1 Tax=Actinocorallia populi TaxID=2079200 RepID=UPI0022B7F8AA|nr:BTAD domain-containing putative transcriptional regulator [Actinocorallia populi]